MPRSPPAVIIPLCAMLDLPVATHCQEWAGVPLSAAVTTAVAVGMVQLTSPMPVTEIKK
ncbi:hypothetical protein [Lacrimispora celerecrescens]|uniref:hypothetical protein n=1 Tax=Lacrimispora celerecrescens TaxID=29354 RepID=UPI001649DA0E|nr:hypothetical protein [Lacrimispora celerecrescens]